MTADEIAKSLGTQNCAAIEAAISKAFVAAQNDTEKLKALRELLVSLLAAIIITPPTGAVERAHIAADFLIALVEKSVVIGHPTKTGGSA